MASMQNPNLISHRALRTVWDKRGWQGPTIEELVAPWFVALGGASLLAFGASRRSWRGVAWMATGAALIGCAAAGLCNPRDLGVRVRHRMYRRADTDCVTMEAIDSFPASDAPSSNATISGALIVPSAPWREADRQAAV